MEAHMNRDSESIEEIDTAIAEDARQRYAVESERLQVAERQQARVERVGSLLRFVGVGVLLAAAATLLMQRWDGMAHIARYFSFLAFTAAVCVAGLLCGVGMKENKGARALLSVVGLLVPVHFAQLGAILYSRFGHTLDAGSYPRYLFWSAPSPQAAVMTTLAGLITLAPMMLLACSVLARRHAAKLVWLSFLAGLSLLYPSREPYLMGTLILTLGAVCARIDRIVFVESESRTEGALVARAIPYLTLALAIARQCFLYKSPPFAHGLVYAGATYVFFVLVPGIVTSRVAVWFSEAMALGFAALAAVMFGISLDELGILSEYAVVMVSGLSLALVVSALTAKAREATGLYGAISLATCVLLGLVHLSQASELERVINGLVCGIVVVAWACLVERRSMLIAGLLFVACSCVDAVGLAVRSVDISPWLLLGLVGLTTVVGASYLERYYLRIVGSLRALRSHVKTW